MSEARLMLRSLGLVAESSGPTMESMEKPSLPLVTADESRLLADGRVGSDPTDDRRDDGALTDMVAWPGE